MIRLPVANHMGPTLLRAAGWRGHCESSRPRVKQSSVEVTAVNFEIVGIELTNHFKLLR